MCNYKCEEQSTRLDSSKAILITMNYRAPTPNVSRRDVVHENRRVCTPNISRRNTTHETKYGNSVGSWLKLQHRQSKTAKSTATFNCKSKSPSPLPIKARPMQSECCIQMLKTSQDLRKPRKSFSRSYTKIRSVRKQQTRRGHQGIKGATTAIAQERANCRKDCTKQSKIGNQICPSKITNLYCLYSKLTYLNLSNKEKLHCKQKEIAKMKPQKFIQTMSSLLIAKPQNRLGYKGNCTRKCVHHSPPLPTKCYFEEHYG